MTRCEVLSDGMTLLVDETHASPTVALALWVPRGAADEPEEHSGVFHFLEHMLHKDRAGAARGLSRVVQDAGGYLNARTGLDHTAYYQVVPSEGWRDVLSSFHAMLSRAEFSPDDVDSERRVIAEESKIAERDPSVFLWRRLIEAAFEGSGYGRPIVGTEESLAGIDAGVLSDFFYRHYRPDGMFQVVVGDVCADEVVATMIDMAEARSSRTPRQAAPTVSNGGVGLSASAPPEWTPSRVAFSGALRQPYVALAFQTPHVMHEDMPALDALCGILGVGRSSRLRKSLRTSLGLVSDIGAGAAGYRDTGVVVVRAVGTDRSEPDRIVEEVFREVRRLKDDPVSRSEVAKGVRRIEAGYALEHETVESTAMTLGFFSAMGDHGYAERYLDLLAGVTPDDIQRVANRYLAAETAAVGAFAPAGLPVDSDSLAEAAARGDAEALREGTVVAGESPGEARRSWEPAKFTRPEIIREAPDVSFTRSELPGGATLVAHEVPGLPLVSVALGFRGGFIDESDDELGLTGLTLKHMLMGTRSRSAEKLADDVEGLGSGISVSVDRDGFGVGLTVLSDRLDEALTILGEAVCRPALAPQTFEHVRAEAQAELGEAEDHPVRRTMRRLRPLLFPGHPYGRATTGSRESLASIEADATRSWHDQRFTTNRLFVSVSGGVSHSRVSDSLVAALDGLLAQPPADVEDVVLAGPARPSGRVEEELERRGQSSVAVGFGGPRVGSDESAALHVASSALTMMGGRLWRALRERPPHAYSVRLTPVPMRFGGALIGHVTTPPGQEEAAVAVFAEELDAVARCGLTAEELERGKRYLAGLIEISMQRSASRAASYAVAEVAGVGYERVSRLPAIIRDVTEEEVVRAARLYVSAEDAPAVAVLRG